jgi:hypothetical protein
MMHLTPTLSMLMAPGRPHNGAMLAPLPQVPAPAQPANAQRAPPNPEIALPEIALPGIAPISSRV